MRFNLRRPGWGKLERELAQLSSYFNEVNVYFGRGTKARVKVGQFTHSPALDHTPLKTPGAPEERHYTVVNVINEQEVGQPSPAVTVVMP